MRLTIIGCAGSFPRPDSPASCYLVEAEHEGRTWRILLDLGSGALGTLQAHADPFEIDAVFFTHMHADHCLDLCGYYVLRKYHPDAPWPAVPVYAPEGAAGRMARAYDLPEDPGMSAEFDFNTYDGSPVRVGPFTVEPVAVQHPVPAYALRVRADGRLLTYTGDTGPCEGLDAAARGADLLLAEASFVTAGRNPVGLHLTGTDVAEAAGRGGVGRVVLTHIPAWNDPQLAFEEARAVFDGPVDLARSGDVYEI